MITSTGDLGCVQRILDFREQTESEVTCLIGNREDWMLRSYHDPTKHSWLVGMEAETIASYSTEVDDLIRGELIPASGRILTQVPRAPSADGR